MPCRRRPCSGTGTPTIRSWRPPGSCTTSATSCPAWATRRTPSAGAGAVGAALGARVAGLVALHVEAKRYLVATEPGYGAGLGPDSVASLATQGGAASPREVSDFAALPLAGAAVALRRADDSGKLEGLVVGDLPSWVPLLRGLSEPRAAGR